MFSNPTMYSTLRRPDFVEKNVVRQLYKSSIHGRSQRSHSFYNEGFRFATDKLAAAKDIELTSFYVAISNVELVLENRKLPENEAMRALSNLKESIREIGKRDENERNLGYTAFTQLLRNLLLYDATKILQRFVMSYSVLPMKVAHAQTAIMLKPRGIVLEIFHEIFVYYENTTKEFYNNHSFLVFLFTHLQYMETCFPACKILECLLLSRKKILDLSTIDYLKEIVACYNDVALGNFCKILAVTLSELDMYEHKTSLYAQTKQKKSQNFYIRDINQDTILKIPKILLRLVNLACAKPYVPWYPDIQMESEQWLKWIDVQCEQERITRNVAQFIGGITRWQPSGTIGPNMSAIKIASELTFRADAVCVLGLLLVGRHRKEVQKELAELQLIPRLCDLFDHFVWRSHTRRDHSRLPGHNSSCECSPEVALKIQVLRLVHSFCDHSDYKHVMLSWNEYSELKALEDSSSSSQLPSMTQESMCVGVKGFLTKIVEVMKKESGASTFRFWLSRAIESYLRGSYSSADQDFLLRRDLLQHVVGNLIASNIRHKEVLQSSFDLLGELIRFNTNAFKQLNAHLNTIPKQKKLESLMNGSLVDSNMFIRSLILSYENFMSSSDPNLKDFAESQCFLLSYVSSLRDRVDYLQKLLGLINIHNLTQENVSCLNTALVILMFASRHSELPQYLQSLASNQEGCSVATNDQSGLMKNLKDLLIFWQDHYLQKDKDCTILERSSRIPFREWKDTVTMLTRDEPENPNCIAFFTVPAVSSRAS